MTVIAYKHPYLVADQRVTEGPHIWGTATKLSIVEFDGKRYYFGTSGIAGLGIIFVNYLIAILKNNIEEQDKHYDRLCTYGANKGEKVSIGCLCVMPDGSLLSFDETCIPLPFKSLRMAAEGHGRDYAMGAMEMGADAWRAANAAVEHDSSCGYPIDGYNVETGTYYCFKTKEELLSGQKVLI